MRTALGIDVGGSKVALALGDESGRILARRRRATEPSGDPDRDLARLAEDARALAAEAGCPLAELAAVGVSLPGPMHPDGSRVLHPPNLPGWGDVPARAILARLLDGLPVRLENDANAATLAEWRFGAGRGLRSIVYLTLSTGLGSGIVLDGRLLRGRSFSAGEVGHAPLVWQGESCHCGLRGCAEAYLGGRAWAERLRRSVPSGSRVAELAGGREQVGALHLVAAAREGDAFALAELARWTEHLAHLVSLLAFVLDPDAVILGTIAVGAGDLVLEPLRERVRSHVWPQIARGLEIRLAALGEDLPYYAGLCTAFAEPPGAA